MGIPVKYENGVFRPLVADVHLKEGTVAEVHVYETGNRPRRPASIGELAIYGMWKDREDIGTGVEYVNRLRDRPRGS